MLAFISLFSFMLCVCNKYHIINICLYHIFVAVHYRTEHNMCDDGTLDSVPC